MNRPIIVVIIIIFLLYTPYLKYKYNKFYSEVPEEIKIEAIILSNPKEEKNYNSYIIKGKNNIFKNKKFILYTKEKLKFGDKIKVTGTFLEPAEQRNYKGYNYKKYLQTQKIYGSIKAKNIKIISKNCGNKLLKLGNNARNKIIKNINQILPNETCGLLIGLLLGDKTSIEEDTITNFQKSSLAHILAVSGTHVSYIILGFTCFLTINKISRKSGYLFTIFILIVFLFLTNFSLSVVRACIMAIIIITSKLIHRKADIINTMGIALLITFIYNPFAIQSVSLQLSYLGTAGVIFLTPIIEKNVLSLKISPKISKIISVPIAAQLSILPIMIINFHTISFTFLISNILAMPLIGVVIILGFLIVIISFICMPLAQKLGIVINLILKMLIIISEVCGNLELSNIYVVTPRTITIIVYYLFLLIKVYIFNLKKNQNLKSYEIYTLKIFSKLPLKKIMVMLIITIFLIEFPYVNYNGNLKIYFIDVGQRRQHTYYKSLREKGINRWRRA